MRPGGGPQQVYETLRRLSPREFEWVVASPHDGPLFARFARLGLVYPVRLNRLRPLALVRVVRLIRLHRVDLVHSHGKGAGLVGRLAGALTGVPAIHTFHGIHAAKYGRAGAALYLGLERWLVRHSAAVVHVSESQARLAAGLGLAPSDRTAIVVNGVDAAAIRADVAAHGLSPHALGLTGAGPVVGTVARLDPVKGVDVFVRALARLAASRRDVQGLIVGGGAEADRLRALAAREGVADRVRFAGEVVDGVRALAALDVYVATSRREGLPLALLEAMACGRPVVASAIPAHAEVLDNGRTGRLVPVDDVAATAEAIASVLADPARARRGAAGQAVVEKRYDIRLTVDGLAAVYHRVMRGRTAAP
jgi:glycosyltransferase involved in cell wall biosynthesis